MNAIILAGGLGTRLQGVVSECPKPMAPVAEHPFLTYLLDYLDFWKVKKVVMAVGYKHEIIINEIGYQYKNISIDYAIEHSPLGTGGAVRLAMEKIDSEYCLIFNGDTFFDIPLNAFQEEALNKQSKLQIALKPLSNFERYGAVIVSENKIEQFKEKQPTKEGLINGGIYCVKSDFIKSLHPAGTQFSFEKEILESQIHTIHYFISDTYFIDIGIPEDYAQAQIDFKGRL